MTTDFIQDACDVLDQSEEPYVILTGIVGSDALRVTSSLGDNVEFFRRELAAGNVAAKLQAHLDRFYPEARP